MYRVALCEDEKVFAETLKKICRGIFDRFDIEYHITEFNSGADFLEAFLQRGDRYDLILLDIIMPGINGVDLARQIRKQGCEAAIIFITSSRDYALSGYDVKALHYLVKPLEGHVLERLIIADYRNRFQNKYLVFKSGVQNLRIPLKDIICLETVGRRVAITLPDSVVYFPGKLLELLKSLPQEDFVRCHQAFAVNLRNIKELTPQTAIAVNGKETPVSRAFKKNVQKAFLKKMRED